MTKNIGIFFSILTTMFLVTSESVLAEEISGQAIRDITHSVRTLCNSPDREGEKYSILADGGAGAIVRAIGIEGEVTFSQSEWSGIQDFLSDRKDLRECTRHLTPLFLSKYGVRSGASASLNQLGKFCRSSQELEVCLDSWNGRAKIASVSLSAWNTSGSDIEVCRYSRYAFAVSEAGEKSELSSNRNCWQIPKGGVGSLAFVFEFDADVGKQFDFALELERPHSQFFFENIPSKFQ